MQIIPARPSDAPFIGRAVVAAIGIDHSQHLAGHGHTVDEITRVFTELAATDGAQYSYRNTLVALDDDGDVMGVCVAYDGAGLAPMREHFLRLMRERFGFDTSRVQDETDASEFYLDSLCVFPEYRGRGIASALIEATAERARRAGKPLGLLVDKENPRARRLYERVGFREVGERPFMGIVMDHLQLPL